MNRRFIAILNPRWICGKCSGHRETEFGKMIRAILALAGCHECGILPETIKAERDHRLSADLSRPVDSGVEFPKLDKLVRFQYGILGE